MRQRSEETQESLEFLRWIYNGYFTFTGCVEFDLKTRGTNVISVRRPIAAVGC